MALTNLCPNCFQYICWTHKVEEEIKRARELLSTAFYATNSKLNRMHVCSKKENEKEFKISKSINIADIFNINQHESLSPHMSNPPQNTCENEASTSSPSILLDNMSTFANLSYTSSIRQDFHDSSPIPSTLTVHGTPDHQADSGFKRYPIIQQHANPTHDNDGKKHLRKVTNKPLKAIKRNRSPDYCRELTKSMRRSHNFEDLT
eukprot:TRINITY_DN55605_c0_g1_i1.p1 TRINITY_DN55605_c0_g1~~TRINITY_DN55605_c0_g1_i1.p1  ORF type:complete len:205 (-),score=35.45 TRINITY_DN55605_c0_g1_i1:55-669(-)